MKAFLSYSSSDKQKVKRIKSDLESHQIECWMDDEDIPFGGNIIEHIGKGLGESDIIMVFLSKRAVLSNWSNMEWQTDLFTQTEKNKIKVIPVLLEDCEIPYLLKPLRRVDFSVSSEYESNLSILLRQLKKKISNVENFPSKEIIDSVYKFTSEILEELRDENISFPSNRKLKIIDSLAKIPRSGKYVRLKKFQPAIAVRSIFDHLHSVAHIADALLPCIDHGLQDYEFAELARLIAFHELNEVILGDIPTYTELSNRKRNASRIYAEDRLRTVAPRKREQIANDLIWMFLSEKQRTSMEEVNSHLRNRKSKVTLIFQCLDKIDPIIATWRYLHVYRGELGSSANEFIFEMKDFFENPDVRSFLKENKIDSNLYDLVSQLQTRKNAMKYYENPDYLDEISPMQGIPASNIRNAIEGIPVAGIYFRK